MIPMIHMDLKIRMGHTVQAVTIVQVDTVVIMVEEAWPVAFPLILG
jgi:hypothetical protein